MTQVQTTIEIVGLKDALREINDVDKKLRRQITKDYQSIMRTTVDDAKEAVPLGPPISGWGRAWTTKSGFQMLPWEGQVGEKYIKAGVSGKRPKQFAGVTQNLAVFFIRWAGMSNTVYDMAGRKGNGQTERGANMIKGLRDRWGEASRVMWPAIEKNRDAVSFNINQICIKIMDAAGRRIAKD